MQDLFIFVVLLLDIDDDQSIFIQHVNYVIMGQPLKSPRRHNSHCNVYTSFFLFCVHLVLHPPRPRVTSLLVVLPRFHLKLPVACFPAVV